MKNYYAVIIVVVLVLVGGWYIYSHPKPVSNPDVLVTEPTRDMCYIWNTEAGDKATLKMFITNGTEIKGSFDYIPAEKDKKTGPIEGTAGAVDPVAMARKAILWWSASGEGVTNKEELFVLFGEGIASPAFGEMKDRGDGVYVYAHPESVSYGLNLQQTDCGDTAVQ
jgi:hypothetical protein